MEAFVTSARFNSFYNPLHRRVYQDMTQPLSSYYISS